MDSVKLPSKVQAILDRAVDGLKTRLGENLYSCILYGSTVRGNAVAGVSDINLLIVLTESTPEAHQVIAEIIREDIQPFILGREGIERSMQAFAVKFGSIRRNYRVLHGADLLADFSVEEDVLRFLCEQATRNLRLRLVNAFVVMGHDPKRYSRYLIQAVPDLFIQLSEALRLSRVEIPKDFPDRIPLFVREFEGDSAFLNDLLNLKQKPRTLGIPEVKDYHSRVFRLMNQAVRWIETQWPPLKTSHKK